MAYGTSTKASNDKNGDGKLGWKGKQEDGHGAEFEMEIGQNRNQNRTESQKGNRTERQKPQKWKGKQSMGKNRMETWNITQGWQRRVFAEWRY